MQKCYYISKQINDNILRNMFYESFSNIIKHFKRGI